MGFGLALKEVPRDIYDSDSVFAHLVMCCLESFGSIHAEEQLSGYRVHPGLGF